VAANQESDRLEIFTTSHAVERSLK